MMRYVRVNFDNSIPDDDKRHNLFAGEFSTSQVKTDYDNSVAAGSRDLTPWEVSNSQGIASILTVNETFSKRATVKSDWDDDDEAGSKNSGEVNISQVKTIMIIVL